MFARAKGIVRWPSFFSKKKAVPAAQTVLKGIRLRVLNASSKGLLDRSVYVQLINIDDESAIAEAMTDVHTGIAKFSSPAISALAGKIIGIEVEGNLVEEWTVPSGKEVVQRPVHYDFSKDYATEALRGEADFVEGDEAGSNASSTDQVAATAANTPTSSPQKPVTTMSWLPTAGLALVFVVAVVAMLIGGRAPVSETPSQATNLVVPQVTDLNPIDVFSPKPFGSVQILLALCLVAAVYFVFKDAKNRGQIMDVKVAIGVSIPLTYLPILLSAGFKLLQPLPGYQWSPETLRFLDMLAAGFCLFIALACVLIVTFHGNVDYSPLAGYLTVWGIITALTRDSGALRLLLNAELASVLMFTEMYPFFTTKVYDIVVSSVIAYLILSSGVTCYYAELVRLIKITVKMEDKILMIPRSLGSFAALAVLKVFAAKNWFGFANVDPVFLYIFAVAVGFAIAVRIEQEEVKGQQEEGEFRVQTRFTIPWDRVATQISVLALVLTLVGNA